MNRTKAPQRTDCAVLNRMMLLVLLLQVLRVGLVVASADWWRLPDIATIAALAGTVYYRDLTIDRLSRRAGR
jgi:hypothetical protein